MSKFIPENMAIGVLAASAIGSMLTQETLDTFHMAGIGNEFVTKGFARIQELLNNSSTLAKIIFKIKNVEKIDSLIYVNFEKLLISKILKINKNEISQLSWINHWEKYFGEVETQNGDTLLLLLNIGLKNILKNNLTLDLFKNFNWPKIIKPLAFSPLMINHDNVYYNQLLISINYEKSHIEEILANYISPNISYELK